MKYIGIIVGVLGIVSLVVGVVFIGLGLHERSYITTQLRQQGITLGLTKEQVANGDVVDSQTEAQVAADTLAKHLQSIAPTYSALMAKNPTGKFDPSDPTDLTYGQGLTLANSLNLVVLGYGVDDTVLGTGAALIVVGLGIGAAGLFVVRTARQSLPLAAPAT